MRTSVNTIAAAASLGASACAAIGTLFPLYVYPSLEYNDNAALWQPSISAIKKTPNNPWLVVINPDSGPGASSKPGNDDVNFISGVSQLNALPNVKNIGYVHTLYAKADREQIKANITKYASWSSYQEKNIGLHGIFFDESSADDAGYLRDMTAFAKQSFGADTTTVCNFGLAVPDEFYDICDVVIAFESCLNCPNGPPYKGAETIAANIPAGREGKASILVNTFSGSSVDGQTANTALLNKYVKEQKSKGLGWTYFTEADYNNVKIIGQLADAVAAA